MRRIFLAFVLVCTATTPTLAEWIFSKSEKPFGGTTSSVVTFGTNAAFIVGCDDKNLRIAIPSAEDWTAALEAAYLANPQIIMAIDGGEPVRISASIVKNGVGKILAESSSDNDELKEVIQKLIDGKKHLDFAVELNNTKFYPSRVSVSGSGKHLKTILSTCASK